MMKRETAAMAGVAGAAPAPGPAALPRRVIAALRLRRDAAVLRRSALFDAAWYLATYPDVALAGLDPARHYLRAGAAENRDPGPQFCGRDYLERNPDVAGAALNPLLHYLRRGRREGRSPDTPLPAPAAPELRPLHAFRSPRAGAPRVTLLTDSIGADSLFGGVATALLFATLLAQRQGATLRVITETRAADAAAAARLLRTHGVAPPADITCVFAARDGAARRSFDVGDGELFVSTAWWNTANLLHAVGPRRIIHLLQEDERMFYPHGDLHLLCAEVLATPGLRFVVNTRLLHTHFTAAGFDSIARHGAWFEPAFPHACYRWEDRAVGARQNFLFYARPNHPRNLYERGLAVVQAAIARRILDPDRWSINFVGRDLTEMSLPRGVRPRLHQGLDWAAYAALVRRCDLGLSLMYTPHPGYPVLDLAASGAVAVTNRYGCKQSLAEYSANILCVDSTEEALLEGLAQGVQRAADLAARQHNAGVGDLARDWTAAFRPAFDRLLEH